MSSAAPYRNPPPGPPNDPTWILLEGRNGWPMAAGSSVVAAPQNCALVLANAPGGSLDLADPSGRFGGLVPPANVAIAPDGSIYLLDVKRGRLRRFDDCACAFVDIPHTGGIGAGARCFAAPLALAARGADLLALDAGKASGRPGRVLVFARHGFSLRAVWAPPPGAVAAPWRPSAFAVTPQGGALVADCANQVVHVFDRGGQWRAAWPGFADIVAMTVDRFGRLFTLASGETQVSIAGADGAEIALCDDVAVVKCCFAPLSDFVSDSQGRINLAGRCAGAGWFDPAGEPSDAPAAAAPIFVASGAWFSTALDSGIGRCLWHRVILDLNLPSGAAFTLASFTSEAPQPDALIRALPASAWTPIPLLVRPPYEALIQSQPGRYLWLQANFSGDQQVTPRLKTLRIEYPRISLRRYLPRAFGPDPASADFADRLLGVFDQGFRSVERQIDNQADLYDARSAPAVSLAPGAPDMLSWLAGWIGLTFERNWPVAYRRRLLREAAKLYPCRGTLPGLRKVLLLYLGLDRFSLRRGKPVCAPACAPKPPPWVAPPMILEHWKIRRWLFLGAGRLDDAATLWGEAIMGRSKLDDNAQLGVTRLDLSRQATADPFNADSFAFTLFVPGGLARSAQQKAAIQSVLDRETPAWIQARLRFVAPRMRIGVQASIGFDAVVGCWPEGVRLDAASLGRASVLGPTKNVDRGPRLGRSLIGSGAPLS